MRDDIEELIKKQQELAKSLGITVSKAKVEVAPKKEKVAHVHPTPKKSLISASIRNIDKVQSKANLALPSLSMYDKALLAKQIFESFDFTELNKISEFLEDKSLMYQIVKDFSTKKESLYREKLASKIGRVYLTERYEKDCLKVISQLKDLCEKKIIKMYSDVNFESQDKAVVREISTSTSWDEIKRRL